MGWFTKKTEIVTAPVLDEVEKQNEAQKQRIIQEEEEAQKAFALEQKRREASWLRNAEKIHVHDIFMNIREDLETAEAQQLTPENKKAHESAVALFDQVRNLWGMIDIQLASDENVSLMFDLIKQTLPEMVQEYLSRAGSNSALAAFTLETKVITGYSRDINTMSYYGDNAIYKYMHAFSTNLGEATKTLLKIKNDIFAQTVYPTMKPPASISSLSMLPLPLNDEEGWSFIHRIEALWAEARTRRNSMEDNYFLEQASSVYVPDAVKMYSTFKLASPEIQKSAREILIQQLGLIEDKLRLIVDKTMATNLDGMRAQLDFLRYKTETDVVYGPIQSEVLALQYDENGV